jgi:ABC-2 type transport system ATP-binding protein
MNSAILTAGLSRRFGRTVALEDVDLAVPEGAIYALVGANGAGKTTMIKLMMNILRPTSGRAEVLGSDSTSMGGKAFIRIGYVSENQEMPDWMTVGNMLDYYRAFYPQWDRALEQQLVRQFDLPLKRKIKQLSRGMRMKAAFVSSLSYHPSLIVLDEPFSGLDPLVRDELIEGLIERAPESTIFLSSHDLAEIESFSSHVGFLEQGRLLFSEEMPTLTDRFRSVTVTLESPSPLPVSLPSTWLEPQAADCVVRFIHSNYNEKDAAEELANIFPSARDVTLDPMSLRSIFLAVAKSGRNHVSPAPVQADSRGTEA